MQADRLGLDYAHFTGQRRWSDEQLTAAVESASSWSQVASMLGLAGGSSTTTVRGHAVRLGLATAHLERRSAPPPRSELQPDVNNLGRSGPLMAAAWFTLCGLEVSWPLEPCRYDLLVWSVGRAERIQVKTTRVRTGRSWTVWLSTTGKERTPYAPEEIDKFFIIDGELAQYLIPVEAVGGLMAIQLSAYPGYRLPQLDPPR